MTGSAASQNRDEPRVIVRSGFNWDAQDAYLFDIDGTLVRNWDGVHFESFSDSVRDITGFEVSLQGVRLAGNTDVSILREACLLAGVPAAVVDEHLQAMLQSMCNGVLARQREMRVVTMPGVEETLRHLAAMNKLLGVASGNLEIIGWAKIEQAGLRQWFRFGGFSDRHPLRPSLVAEAALKARKMAGDNATVCVVGDTPYDIEAARANSLPVIAVATGRYAFDELAQHRPDLCATSLAGLLTATRERTAP